MTPALFVNSLKIGVLQEPVALRESVLGYLRHSGFRRQASGFRSFVLLRPDA
jgi:hypothetical protein